MNLTFGYSFAHHGLGLGDARAWFSGNSGLEPTLTGQWANVMEAHAGTRLEAHSGTRLEAHAGERLDAHA